MKLSNRLLMASFALTLPLMAQADVTKEDLTGTWYSEKEDSGETLKRLIKRDANNSYAELLLICDGKEFSWVQKELGSWELVDDKTFKVTMDSLEDMNGKKPADPNNATATYIDVKRDGDNLKYTQQGKGNSYDFNLVDDGYQVRCE